MGTTLRLSPKTLSKITPDRIALPVNQPPAAAPEPDAQPKLDWRAKRELKRLAKLNGTWVPKPPPEAWRKKVKVKAPPAKPQKTPEEKAEAQKRLREEAERATRQRKADNKALRQSLTAQFPTAFNPIQPVPLMLRIDQAITERTGCGRNRLKVVLRVWTSQTSYLLALAAGGPRFDLDGNPVGLVTEEQQAQAREALDAHIASYRVKADRSRRGKNDNSLDRFALSKHLPSS